MDWLARLDYARTVNTNFFWSQFEWLLMQALSIVRVPLFGWIFLALVSGVFISAALQNPFRSGRWKHHYFLVFTHALVFLAILSVGVLYRVPFPDPTKPLLKENAVADWTLNILFFLSIILSIFWVYRMRNLRWLAFFVVALQELFLLSALFVAGMSISGDWI
ncbi:MAG: hypothetical protein LAO03_22490 [Acidobacteriia bacterium]|nr:hypothetical protein [Terriglobia bacterium]